MILRFITYLMVTMFLMNVVPTWGYAAPESETTEQKALEETRKAAESGNPEAQFQLGNTYYLGKGGKADTEKAKLWFEKAAQQNHVEAQANLGVLLYMGATQEKDIANAVEWFQKAALQGHAGARKHLGILYDTGQGVPPEIQSKVFEPFFTTKDIGKGTGLGLSLVYEIVQRHKGEITLQSGIGKGTTFFVRCPLLER